MMEFERQIKRIGKRDWNSLRDLWISVTPVLSFPLDFSNPITPPNLHTIKDEIVAEERNTTNKRHYSTIDGLHQYMLCEAVYLFYKTLNVFRSFHTIKENGFLTWSTVNSYQCSYFGIKAILNLLGICYIRIDSKDFIIDSLPNYKRISKKDLIRRREIQEVMFLLVKQPEHYDMWRLFQKVVTTCNIDIWDGTIINFLHDCSPKHFAKHRNKAIYQNTKWIFNDLSDILIDLNVANRPIYQDGEIELSIEDLDFTIIICYLIVKMGLKVFEDLGSKLPAFNEEYVVMSNIIQTAGNENYFSFHEKNEFSF
ncbi:hypothetical protein ACFL5V_00470 [Fibrobacterota bacterium]